MSTKKPKQNLLTMDEAAKLAGISHQALRQAARKGVLKTVTVVVERIMVDEAELLRYVGRKCDRMGRPIRRKDTK